MTSNAEPSRPEKRDSGPADSRQHSHDTGPSGNSLSTRHFLSLLRYAIIALCIGSAIALAALLIFAPEQRLRLIAPAIMTSLALGGGLLLGVGRVRAAIYLLVFGSWLGVTAVAFLTEGVRSPVVIAYPLVILMSGWLISSRTALAVTAATVAATIAFVAGESMTLLPAPLPSSALVRAGDQIFVYLLSGALIMFLVRVFKNRLRDLHSITDALAARSKDLELREAELRRAQAVARIGSWIYDFGSGEMNFSDECCRILGLSGSRATGYDAYLQLTHAEDRRRVERDWHGLLEGTPLDNEHRIDDGKTVRWIRQKAELEHEGREHSLRIVGIAQDITERKRAEAEINSLAFYDTLTGLPNRRLLTDRLKQALASSVRTGNHGALLFVDLDNFKSINDTLGHAVGDQLLEQVARRIQSCVREADTLARFGGDEFAIVLGDLGGDLQAAATQAEAFGERILAQLDRTFQLGPHAHHVTASAGIAMFPTGQESSDEVLKHADVALYQAAGAGRNSLRFFDPVTQAAVAQRAALEEDLHEAIRSGQFILHFQAQVVDSARMTGAEALVRWIHPARGIVAPDEFIALAEESGLIVPLGRRVLEMACTQLRRWAERSETAELTLAVNVSARQFHDDGFVEQVLDILERTGANPHRLKIELTESVLVRDAEEVIARMAKLKACGVSFALDDFGTGYSSLSYLKRLPLDQLKIDRSFIRNVLTDPNDAAIAKTIIALADRLGMSVIAEGVELDAQREFLGHHGCHAFQGYLFSRPLPLPAFENLLRSS